MKTSLIQRGKFEDRDYKKGIDSIIHFDYMGSSEFEWGALPESLTKIRADKKNYIYTTLSLNDKSITVFCKKSQQNELEQYLDDLSNNKMRLQEHSDFNNYIKPIKGLSFKNNTDLWWDIQNNLMFWKEEKEFENKFKNLI